MCGRYAFDADPVRFAEHFMLTGDLDLKPSWNIAPLRPIYTITADDQDQRHLNKMRWGFIPHWSDDPNKFELINSKGETVAEKPLFKSAFRSHRCLIPASGFYEWKTEAGKKYPWYISLKSGNPMAFAGIWETWRPKDGETIETCCIITTSANELMAPIHDRMPVILDTDQWSTWLSPQVMHPELLLPMIRPHEAGSMQAWPVSRELNKVGVRDDAGLINQVTPTP